MKGWFMNLMIWARNLPLPSAQKTVLLVLCTYSDSGYQCHPGQATIAQDSGLSDRTVRRALKELEEAGILFRKQRYGEGNYRTSDEYFLNTDYRSEKAS